MNLKDFKSGTLSQAQICEVFGKAKSTVSEHIKAIFEDGELSESSTVRNYRTVEAEGNREVSRDIDFYNLDMIIAIGLERYALVKDFFIRKSKIFI